MAIRAYQGVLPTVHPSCFVDESAQVIGDVHLGEDSSIWFNTVVRGDVNSIRIGRRTNIQDLSIVHVTHERFATQVGDEVTVGHHVVLHGCRIGNRVLVGMGAIVLDGVMVEDDSLIAAGTLLSPGTHIPAGSLVMGSPGRIKRVLSPEERRSLRESADGYVGYAANYRARSNQRP
jgi:carbonic anhydrase/acetyltransferase-like protein (isoleucine patch superfamily)